MECKCGLPAEVLYLDLPKPVLDLSKRRSRCSVVGTAAFLFIIAT